MDTVPAPNEEIINFEVLGLLIVVHADFQTTLVSTMCPYVRVGMVIADPNSELPLTHRTLDPHLGGGGPPGSVCVPSRS